MRTQFLLRSVRKSAFYELHSLFKACQRRNDQVQMIGHDYEFMKKISRPAIVINRIDQQIRPALIAK